MKLLQSTRIVCVTLLLLCGCSSITPNVPNAEPSPTSSTADGRSGSDGKTSTQQALSSRPATATPQPTTFPVYATNFQSSNNPYLMTFNALVTAGAYQPTNASAMSTNLWNQGAGKLQGVNAFPLYGNGNGNASYSQNVTFTCQYCGNANNLATSIWKTTKTQSGSDHHLTIINSSDKSEDDYFGCTLPASGSTTVACTYGGYYPFSTKGLQGATGSNHSGNAIGLFEITAGDLLNGKGIQHALGLNTACLDNDTTENRGGAVYPSDQVNGTDESCAAAGLSSGAPPYGALWHLKNSVSISSLGYGQYCTEIVQAMQTYGLYLIDTGNLQLQVEVENPQAYDGYPYQGITGQTTVSNPFVNTIFPSMVSSKDGDKNGASTPDGSFEFGSCFNHLTSSMFEIYYAPNLGF